MSDRFVLATGEEGEALLRVVNGVPGQGRDGVISARERNLAIPRRALVAFCVRHRILRLALFGSVLREDFHAASDVDVLVEFETGAAPGLLRKSEIRRELSRILGREVDLRVPSELSPYIRDRVMESAEVQYVRG